MSLITRPLLASHVKDFEKLVFPLFLTPKLDGIRVIKVNGDVVTRKFKSVPNRYIRSVLSEVLPEGIDGEIIGESKENFNATQSAVMSFDGTPNFTYAIFDYVSGELEEPYLDRINKAKSWYQENKPTGTPYNIELLFPVEVHSLEQMIAYEEECIARGYEGAMIRKPDGKYKCGRSTEKEQILLKLKRFADSEAIVTGFVEKMTNTNEQEMDEFGLAKRSSKKEGMIPAGVLGALVVRDVHTGVAFQIGSGFNDQQKNEIWKNKMQYLNKIAKYKHQKQGAKSDGAPRFPIFQGWRDPRDMSPINHSVVETVSFDNF